MAIKIHVEHTQNIQIPHTTWFIYGETGAGKTMAASTFPNPFFIVPANEKSQYSLLEEADEQGIIDFPFVTIGKDAVTKKRILARDHLNATLKWLEDLSAKAEKIRIDGKHSDEALDAAFDKFPYETVVIESMTHMTDLIVEDISQFGAKRMDQLAWGHLSSFIRSMHDRLRSLDVHVVYTALPKTVESDSGIVYGKPNLVGSMADKLPSACDVIAYMEEVRRKEESKYVMHLRKHKHFAARSRFGRMPPKIDNFDFDEIQQFLGRKK